MPLLRVAVMAATQTPLTTWMKGQKRECILVFNSVAQSITQDETLWHNSNRSMTAHY